MKGSGRGNDKKDKPSFRFNYSYTLLRTMAPADSLLAEQMEEQGLEEDEQKDLGPTCQARRDPMDEGEATLTQASDNPTPHKTATRKFVSPTCSPSKCDHELPSWCSRPFCRSNTQSEPEDFCCSSHSSCSSDGVDQATAFAYSEDEDELPECHRGCPEYYYLSARGGRGGSQGEQGREGIERVPGHMTESEDTSADQEEAEISPSQGRSTVASLGSGFALILFVALPMLARHLGALVSRRILAYLYRS